MAIYHSILVAIDLSEYSTKIVEQAIAIQASDLCNADTQLKLLHVVESAAAGYGGEFTIPVDLELQQQITSAASQQLDKIAQKYGISTQQRQIVKGPVHQTVIAQAHSLSADLLVIGSHAKQGLEHLLGSHASKLMQDASCNVLLVRC